MVRVSVVALPTKVSVEVGKVKVPLLIILAIPGVVRVLLVRVSVVALPTKVSLVVGKVKVPLLITLAITGVVRVLLDSVCVPVKVTEVEVVAIVSLDDKEGIDRVPAPAVLIPLEKVGAAVYVLDPLIV